MAFSKILRSLEVVLEDRSESQPQLDLHAERTPSLVNLPYARYSRKSPTGSSQGRDSLHWTRLGNGEWRAAEADVTWEYTMWRGTSDRLNSGGAVAQDPSLSPCTTHVAPGLNAVTCQTGQSEGALLSDVRKLK